MLRAPATKDMKKEHIFCDVCSDEISGGVDAHWDLGPSSLTFVMGGPGANDGKVYFEHVCYTCRKGLRNALDGYVASRAKVVVP